MAAVDGKWAPTPASFLRPALPRGHVQPGFVDLAAWMPGEGIRGGESGTSWFPLPPRGAVLKTDLAYLQQQRVHLARC